MLRSWQASQTAMFVALMFFAGPRIARSQVISRQPADSQARIFAPDLPGSTTLRNPSSLLDGDPPMIAEWALDKTPTFLWGSATVTSKLDWVRIAFGSGSAFSGGLALFDDVTITANDIGRTFTVDASQDPDFTAITQLLTNGSSADSIFVVTGIRGFGAAGANHPESYWAANPAALADFKGYQITSIGLYIDNASFANPGSNPNHDGIWTDYRIDRKLRFFGEPAPTPEPGAALVAIGVVAALRQRARRR